MEVKDFKFSLQDFDEESGTFGGYASVFGVTDAYGDVMMPRAFKKTLKENPHFPLLWYHDVRDPLGIIQVEEDEKGLKVKRGELNLDVQSALEKRSLMKQKAIKGLSIGFNTVQHEWDEENKVRKIKEVRLWEVSLVVFGACPGALVDAVKEMPEEKPFPNEHSARLQDPKKFDKFRRTAGGKLFNKIEVPETIGIIWGHLKGEEDDSWAAAALRFPTKDWTVTEAKAWLKKNEVEYQEFEPAEKSIERLLEPIVGLEAVGLKHSQRALAHAAADSLVALLTKGEPPEGIQSGQEPSDPMAEFTDLAIEEAISSVRKTRAYLQGER